MADYMDAYAPVYGYQTDYAGDCVADLASATTTTWILIGLGILVALVSALIMATIRSGTSRSAAVAPEVQTMASKIENLARLRDKGLVTDEEYERKPSLSAPPIACASALNGQARHGSLRRRDGSWEKLERPRKCPRTSVALLAGAILWPPVQYLSP